MHIIKDVNRPRDFAEVVAVEIAAIAMASQSADGEFWELRPAPDRNEYRKAALDVIGEALQFWADR